jgi:hypothetical protein
LADGEANVPGPSSRVYAPPDRADRALLVVHGAGEHNPITSLDEIVNPTLSRLRYEGNLVAAQRFAAGDPAQPGGRYDGLVVDYVYGSARCDHDERTRYGSTPLMPRAFLENTDGAQRLLVLEGRWDSSFLDPGRKEVSSWAGHHVGRMMFELFLYHLRNPLDVIASIIILALFAVGAWQSDNDLLVAGLLTLMGAVAFLAAFIDAIASWRERSQADQLTCAPADLTPATINDTHWFWYAVVPAVTMSVYQIQRAFVLPIALAAMVILTLLAPLVRVLATVPGLNWAAQNLIFLLEAFALAGAPTDVESISNNPVASAAIQTRLLGALAEIESRLPPGAEITVLGHSAAAPLAFWLLSEPGIHRRQRVKQFKYRLITVGGALNWAKRGMDCEATPLDRPLVNSDGADDEKTYWLDCHSTWDPTPHGPVRRKEYEGDWRSWPQREPSPPVRATDSGWLFGVLNKLRRNWWRGELADRPGCSRDDPNMLVRNLGSPISAEHSEYFRNQQEFVPAFVRAIDSNLPWAIDETKPARKHQWENARLALLSGLVRGRMAVFIVPLAAFVATLVSDEYLITSCDAHRSGRAWWLLGQIGSGMRYLFEHLPVLGDRSQGVCNFVLFEQLAIVVVIALICYALVDVYTNFCWVSLGRSVAPLDEALRAADADPGPRGFLAKLTSPRRWYLWQIPARPLLLVWVPTLIPPLLFAFVFPIPPHLGTWLLLVAANVAMMPFEIAWLSRCLRMAPEAGVAYGRSADTLQSATQQ